MSSKILVIGSSGQIGTELVEALATKHGNEHIIASDIRQPQSKLNVPFEHLNIMDKQILESIVQKNNISEVYLLAAMLSATAEQKPALGWDLNMTSLFNVLELAKEGVIKKVFWPSSIAVFGPSTPKENTPQFSVMEPNTVYGISKQAGERWCEYYYNKYGVDARSIRYPGLIGWKSQPGGGTTDYAVHIFYEALKNNRYECFLNQETTLPMMYMEDAISATMQIMDAPKDSIKIRSSYNISGISFSPEEIANEIKQHIPDFTITYNPDYRQQIASGWPQSINDNYANEHWEWSSKYSLKKLVETMLSGIEKNLKKV